MYSKWYKILEDGDVNLSEKITLNNIYEAWQRHHGLPGEWKIFNDVFHLVMDKLDLKCHPILHFNLSKHGLGFHDIMPHLKVPNMPQPTKETNMPTYSNLESKIESLQIRLTNSNALLEELVAQHYYIKNNPYKVDIESFQTYATFATHPKTKLDFRHKFDSKQATEVLLKMLDDQTDTLRKDILDQTSQIEELEGFLTSGNELAEQVKEALR